MDLLTGLHGEACGNFASSYILQRGFDRPPCVAYGYLRHTEEERRLVEPDCSFGPRENVGAVLPAGLVWFEYHTLKVEIGVCRG